MDSLPNELLIQIASHLELPPPSVVKFAQEPSSDLTRSEELHLKALSQVSWRWRKVVLPVLFKYSRITLDDAPQWVPIDARLIETMQSQLSQLSGHELQIYQKMRNKFKSTPSAFDEVFDDLQINLCRIQPGDDFLSSSTHILWFPHLPDSFVDFTHFVNKYDLKHHIKSLAVSTPREYELRHVSQADSPLIRAVAEIWSNVFAHFEPSRVIVAAPPTTLAGLLDTPMMGSDAWAFEMKMHYVELVQPGNANHSDSCRPWDTALIHRRPWSHVGYNEGSSITAYSTYEYHLKQSPKMLYLLILRLSKEVQPCCNIQSFSFVGVFPFSTNITPITKALFKIRSLRRIQFQLAPGPENNLLSTPKKLGRAQPGDLWLEWNDSYKVIAEFIDAFDFEDGAEFISTDCNEAARESEVEHYMQLLQGRGIGWKQTGTGAWLRDHSLDKATVDATYAGVV
ncbi:hypothetical protein K491DRAFT_234818 [Lophiostoma macrostomum CBS 122681]|uniref:Uncharacterized protein n=1 Tax=Lophiostoma macrostomum CBS 122681 TaxID=1314788 RepID=A0A6A6THF6_9PLEO|nr:hypothetical protein K491DRAFT_234818 [Lophiostoma macrostomum CBS 122681]